jgi:hypothetical protein
MASTSSPAKALMASTYSHIDSVMNSVRSPSSRRSIQAPRLQAVLGEARLADVLGQLRQLMP